MIAILLSAALTCLAALFLGQGALRLAGATSWSWLAPPVGVSVAMVISVPAIDVPGRSATVAALLAALTAIAAIWCLREPAHRPPLGPLLAAAPVAILALIPFLAAGRTGIPGTAMNNDLAVHMAWVEAYISPAVEAVTPPWPDYPLGPHAMVAAIAKGASLRVDEAFAGWAMALPLLNAWTAMALVRRASWLTQAATAIVVGMPFLVAAYYGQAAFKEVLLAGLVLALTLSLAGYGPALGRGRWVPFALLSAGIVSMYSITGLPWPLAILGLWLAGTLALWVRRRGDKGLVSTLREQLPMAGLGLAVFVICLLPQAARLERFVSVRSEVNGTGIRKDDLGNLVGPLPGWEALGVWNTPDFRFPASPAFTGAMWTAFALALVLAGTVWAFRRGRWLLPLAAAGSMLIWAVSTDSQSPYVAAKALVVASPLLLVLAVLPLAERGGKRPWWWAAVPLVTLVLVARVGLSDVEALRISPVGPTDHMSELRSLRPLLDGRETLFLGNDDYIEWELAGVPVASPVLHTAQELPLRPEKTVEGGPFDFDSVDAATLNAYEWVITTRDAAGSAPPAQLRLVRETDSYALWRRTGEIRERSVLAEGGSAGGLLDCGTPEGRRVARSGGIAAVRTAPVEVPLPGVAAGTAATIELDLPRGRWQLVAPYTSSHPLTVSAPGLRTTLPANLDRPGPRWPIGRVRSSGRRPLQVTFAVEDTALAPANAGAAIGTVIATRVEPGRTVPLADACGRYVDWYRSARGPA